MKLITKLVLGLMLCGSAFAQSYEDTVERILDSVRMSRNFALEDIRISFVEALSPSISEDALSLALLFTQERWDCMRYPAFYTVDFDGAKVWDTQYIKYSVKRGRVIDSDGFAYAYRNELEVIGNTKQADILRSLRYEYYCDDYPNCTKDNYTGINLIIEESKRGEGLLSYISRYFNGIDAEDAAAALLRSQTTQALNRRMFTNCSESSLLTGCELAINYYVCEEAKP